MITGQPKPKPKENEPGKCHDCGAKIGELHEPNCDWEECPFCHGQMFSCGCLTEKILEKPEVQEMMEKILKEIGQIPFGQETRKY